MTKPWLKLAILPLAAGCGDGPARVEAPDWRPSRFADAVLAELDVNEDEALDDEELTASPGLEAGKRAIDLDQDGRLSRDELEARFSLYESMRIGLAPRTFRVTYNRRPLARAEVRLVPEFFLEGVLEPATGFTDRMGCVQPAIEGEQLGVMRVGYYRVEVRMQEGELPAQGDEATTVGVEVPPVADNPSVDGTIEISLGNGRRR